MIKCCLPIYHFQTLGYILSFPILCGSRYKHIERFIDLKTIENGISTHTNDLQYYLQWLILYRCIDYSVLKLICYKLLLGIWSISSSVYLPTYLSISITFLCFTVLTVLNYILIVRFLHISLTVPSENMPKYHCLLKGSLYLWIFNLMASLSSRKLIPSFTLFWEIAFSL